MCVINLVYCVQFLLGVSALSHAVQHAFGQGAAVQSGQPGVRNLLLHSDCLQGGFESRAQQRNNLCVFTSVARIAQGEETTLGGKLTVCLLSPVCRRSVAQLATRALLCGPTSRLLSAMRTVLFCSHKGGPGKTSLLSHTVSQYAESHPDRKVLLIDCSVPADVTRQVLGGDHDFKGEENFDKVFSQVALVCLNLLLIACFWPCLHMHDLYWIVTGLGAATQKNNNSVV